MIHPDSTSALEAPPLHRRGEGLGVGGLSLVLATFLTTQATAQIIPTGTPAADIRLSTAITEHRIFLTRSALEPQTHRQILSDWQRDVTAATAILTDNKVPPEAIATFRTAAKLGNLRPAPNTPFAEVRELCDAQPDWMALYGQLNPTILALNLSEAFK